MGSLAYLNANAAVTNYELPTHPQHVSQNPSDLQNVIEAQIVSKNKDNYNEKEAEQNELTSGPPKKFIDDPQKETQSMPLSNFAHSVMQQNKQQRAAKKWWTMRRVHWRNLMKRDENALSNHAKNNKRENPI